MTLPVRPVVPNSTSDSLAIVVRAALDELKSRLTRRFGERLQQFLLFGSYARGEARQESDVDVLVIIDVLSGLERGEVYEIGAEVWMDTRVRLAPMAFAASEWAQMIERELLLPDDIAREGVLL